MPLLFQYRSNTGADRLNGKKRLDGAAEDPGGAQTVAEYDSGFARRASNVYDGD